MGNTTLNYSNDEIPEPLRKELLKYDKHRIFHCLPCGYQGYFGVIKRYWKWYFQWWFILLTLPFGLGGFIAMVRGFIVGVGGGFWYVRCPNCGREYKTG